ncbi:MAG: MBL fold metallo-hydrolase [Saprospiraceae bacterium]
MKITLLGTGTSQGVPVIGCRCEVCLSGDPHDQRLRTAALVETDEVTVVIDVGPDFRQQMLRADVNSLDAVLITHEHNDHIIGMDDVRPFNFLYKKAMPVHASAEVLEMLKERFAYAFSARPYPGAPAFSMSAISKGRPFSVGSLNILPIEVMHGSLPVLGFRFGPLAYITDAKTIAGDQLALLEGVEVLILNALHHKEHYSHLNLEGALALIEQLSPREAWLTHISHSMGLHREVNQQLPDHIQLAHDTQVIEI